MARGLGRLVGLEDRARKPIKDIVREIEQGDEAQRGRPSSSCYELTGDELAQVFPHLIRAMKDESEMVRNAAATVVGQLSQRLSGEAPVAEAALTALLDDPSPQLRARAAKSLGSIAASGRLDAPLPRLVACLDDEDEQVRFSAAEALVEYRKGPELIVPVALRRLSTDRKVPRNAFTVLFWNVRLEPSVLPLLIGGLSSEDAQVRLVCTAAINHMGREARPALPAILTLLRKELETPHPPDSPEVHDRIIAMAAGAIGEVTSDGECPPGCVEVLCEILKRRGGTNPASATARPDSPGPSHRFLGPQEEVLAEAVWSLGILGRSASPPCPSSSDARVGAASLQPPRDDRRGPRRDQSRDDGRGPRSRVPGERLEDIAEGAEGRDRPGALEAQPEVGTARRGAQTMASRSDGLGDKTRSVSPISTGIARAGIARGPGFPVRTMSRS